ncbi:hypothetical protein GP486_007912, partial [Trichoglossum hirsutum]
MKLCRIALLATAGSIVAAQPHKHQHFHRNLGKRNPAVTVVDVPGPTVIAYALSDGSPISEEECLEGIRNGTLVWADGDESVSSTPAVVPVPAPAPTPTPSSSNDVGAAFYQKPSSSPAAQPPSSGSSPSSSSPDATGLDLDFPDGQVDCSTFPSQYGAFAVPWEGLGGYSGIQYVTFSGDGSSITHIDTAVSGMGCTEGAMCSYACPPGYQKSQWPTAQGSTGQSIGGLLCKNGKLHLTNPDLSKKLCIEGVGNVVVKNQLGENVAICRTDYPGTESETIPTNVGPGQTEPLTCPNGNTYYQHQGAITSAQYYLNPAGVSVDKACTWGSSGSSVGNWAPMNLGIGQRDGLTWIGLFANAPTNPNTAALNYKVEITGNLGGSCKFEGGGSFPGCT